MIFAKGKKQKKNAAFEEAIAGYLFMLPVLIGLLVFLVGPVIYSFIISFKDFTFLNTDLSKWVGLENYKNILHDKMFHKALWNTLRYTLVVVPIQTILALLLGYFCSQDIKFKTFFRSAYYLPSVTSSVAVTAIFMFLFSGKGLANVFLSNFGFQAKSWFADPKYALPLCMIIAIWTTTGTYMILFMAGITEIPKSLYEAAQVDGATEVQKFTNITLPLLRPTTFFVVVMGLIGALQIFDYSFIISGGNGGPVDSTLTVVLYLYRKAFSHFEMGYASAIAFILFIIIFILTLLQKKLLESGFSRD